MKLLTLRPAAPLGLLVSGIWYFESEDDLAHAFERIVPDGAMQLLVNLHEDELRWREGPQLTGARSVAGAALGGAMSRAIAIDTAQQRAITGVSFVPGGAAAFFREPATAFSSDHVALADLNDCRYLREQLLQAEQPESILHCWSRFLTERLKLHHNQYCRWLPAARAMLNAGEQVAAVAHAVNLPERRFRSQFANLVGLPPKRYARVQRLQRLIRAAAAVDIAAQPPNWSDLALAHGYFDQAHMIHDFQALAGINPARYSPRNAQDWNHAVMV